MATLNFINGSLQEQPVSPTAQLPATVTDGYTTAMAFVVTINGSNLPVTLANQAGRNVDIFNNTGTDLEYRRGTSSVYFPIPVGTARLIPAIGGNANTISIRRIDQSSTSVTLSYEVLN